MSEIAGKIKENIADRVADVFWAAVKAAGVALGLRPIRGQTACPGTLNAGFLPIAGPLSANRAF